MVEAVAQKQQELKIVQGTCERVKEELDIRRLDEMRRLGG